VLEGDDVRLKESQVSCKQLGAALAKQEHRVRRVPPRRFCSQISDEKYPSELPFALEDLK